MKGKTLDEDERKSFWRRWMEADEMEQLKMVRTLPCFTRGAVCRYMTATLMQSYLLDLYIETRRSRSTSMPVTTGVKEEAKK